MWNSLGHAAIAGLIFFLCAFLFIVIKKQGLPPLTTWHANKSQAHRTVDENNEAGEHQAFAKNISSQENSNYAAQSHSRPNGTEERNQESDEALTGYTYWLMAYTGGLFFATFVLGIATVGLLFYAGKQARDMEDVIKTSRDANKIALDARRPWVSAPVRLDGSALVFKNIGQMPTRGLHIDFHPVPAGGSPTAIRGAVCKETIKRFERGNDFNLMPQAEWGVAFDDIPSANLFENGTVKPGDKIAGCVAYGSPFDDIVHWTGFTGRIGEDGGRLTLAYVQAENAT